MAISLAGTATIGGYDTSDTVIYTPTAGNAVVLCVTHQAETVESVIDDAGNTWLLAASAIPGESYGQSIYYCLDVVPFTAVTVTMSGQNGIVLLLSEWSGVRSFKQAVASGLQTITAGGSTTAATVDAHIGELIVGSVRSYINPYDHGQITLDAGFTALEYDHISSTSMDAAYHVAAADGPDGPTWTLAQGFSATAVTALFSEEDDYLRGTVTEDHSLASSGQYDINAPTGAQSGDLVVGTAVWSTGGTANDITLPVGWSFDEEPTAHTNCYTSTFHGTYDGTGSVHLQGPTQVMMSLLFYDGTRAAFGGASAVYDHPSTDSTTVDAPAFTAQAGADHVLSIYNMRRTTSVLDTDPTFSEPSTVDLQVNHYDQSPANGAQVVARRSVSSTAVDANVMTLGTGVHNASGIQIALKGAAAQPPSVLWSWGWFTGQSDRGIGAMVTDPGPYRLKATNQADSTVTLSDPVSPSSTSWLSAGLNTLLDGDYDLALVTQASDGAAQDWDSGTLHVAHVGDPVGGYTFLTGSCQRTGSNPAVFDQMRSEDARFFVHQGDLHYGNAQEVGVWRNAVSQSMAADKFQQLLAGMSMDWVWDNHDFGGQSPDYVSDSTYPVATWGPPAMRELRGGFVDDRGLYSSWTCGRVLFIHTDQWLFKSPVDDPESDSKVCLGAEQEAWLYDRLLAGASDDYDFIVWFTAWPLYSNYVASGRWGSYMTENARIGAWLDSHVEVKNKLIGVAGDSHGISADSGANAMWGIPSLNASPFAQSGGLASGTWDIANIDVDDTRGYYSRLTYTPAVGDGPASMLWEAVQDDGAVMASHTVQTGGSPAPASAYRGSAVDDHSPDTNYSYTFAAPGGAVAGDLILGIGLWSAGSTRPNTLPIPAGWSFLVEPTLANNSWACVVMGTYDGSGTISWPGDTSSNTGNAVVQLGFFDGTKVAYSGAGAAGVRSGTSAQTTIPGFTALDSGIVVVTLAGQRNSNNADADPTFSPNSDIDDRYLDPDSPSFAALVIAERYQSSATVDQQTVTFVDTGSQSGNSLGVQVALRSNQANQGSVVGTFDFSGQADGATTRAGTASGGFDLAGEATGEQGATGVGRGSVTGTFTLAGQADGAAAYQGSVDGGFDLAGTADGQASQGGRVDGFLDWNGEADGLGDYSGTGESGGVAWSGVAVGHAPTVGGHSGVAVGTFKLTGSATGGITQAGYVEGAFELAGSAAGATERSGSAEGGFAMAGDEADGETTLSGSASGALALTGTATGKAPGPSTGEVDITVAAASTRIRELVSAEDTRSDGILADVTRADSVTADEVRTSISAGNTRLQRGT